MAKPTAGVQRYAEPCGKPRLRQMRGGAHAAGIGGLIFGRRRRRNSGGDTAFAAVGHDFNEPPVRFQPYAHGEESSL